MWKGGDFDTESEGGQILSEWGTVIFFTFVRGPVFLLPPKGGDQIAHHK